MCRTSSVQMIQLHLEKKEYIWSPATFKGDLSRYIAFNPGIDLVALPNSGYPGGYLCNSFPNAMSISLASVPFIQQGLFTERRRGWGSCFRSNIFLIYPLVVTNRGDYGPLPFEKASLMAQWWKHHWAITTILCSPVPVSRDLLNTVAMLGCVRKAGFCATCGNSCPCVSQGVKLIQAICDLW